MNAWIYVFGAPLILVFLFLATRLVTSAYFKSKGEYLKKKWEEMKNE